jgi:hypothetical protein
MNQGEVKGRGIDIPGCLRRLSNFERYLLWSPENNMAAIVRIFGNVQEDALKRAIDSVGLVHPLMGARVVIDAHHDIWFSTDQAQKATMRTVVRDLKSSGSKRFGGSTLCLLSPLWVH